jgi:hypothetical protein
MTFTFLHFSLNVFLSPILCNHESGNLIAYGDIACASLPNIVSPLFALILDPSRDFDCAPYNIDVSSCVCPTCAGKIYIVNLQVTFLRILHNPYVTFTPSYGIGSIFYLFAIEVIHAYKYVLGSVLVASLNLLLTCLLAAVLFYRIPFQLPRSNRWQAGYRFCHIWICGVLFIDALTSTIDLDFSNEDTRSVYIIDYVLIFGLWPSFHAGSWLMKSRYQSLQTLADSVVADCKSIADNGGSDLNQKGKYHVS